MRKSKEVKSIFYKCKNDDCRYTELKKFNKCPDCGNTNILTLYGWKIVFID